MTSYKDALKSSQGEQGNFIKLPIAKSYQIKDGKFAAWNKETEVNDLADSIAGVLIGTALKMSVFDNNHGKKGGTWNSTWYFTNQDKVVVFTPDGNKDFVGTAEKALEYLFNTVRANPKKRSCLFMATKEGLVEVQSNVTLTIAQNNTLRAKNKDVFLDSVIKLIPATYAPENFDKKVHDILGKLVEKNPPHYAVIDPVQPITDAIAEQLNLQELALTFTKWKLQITNPAAKQDAEPPKPTVEDYANLNPDAQNEPIEEPTHTPDGTPIDKLPF